MPRKRTEQGTLQIGGQPVPFVLTRTRRKTLGMSVGERGVRVNVPWWVPRAEINEFISERKTWLERTLKQLEARRPPEFESRDGATISYLGVKLKLRVVPCLFTDVRRVGRVLWVSATRDEEVAGLVQVWLRHRAQHLLARRVRQFAARLERRPDFALSNARTQWGICHPNGRIRLNWRLIQAPMEVIDYVAAHEVAHLVHLDHSPRFWRQVGALFAGADNGREWLRKNGHALMTI
jgi:predicted metal-dependent hydrolase